MGNLKYETLVYRNKPERGKRYLDGTYIENTDNEITTVGCRGACQIKGAKIYVVGELITQPIFINPYTHKHDVDEYLGFTGAPGLFDWGDTRVEFTFGYGDDAELYVLDRPAVIRIPPNIWHGPLNFVNIDQPVFFEVILNQGIYSGTYLMPEGERELAYNGEISCLLDPDKHCNVCKRCLSLEWDK